MTDDLELLDIPSDDPVAVLDIYQERGWGDGLPVIPPTPERVDAMLAALGDVDPDEVVATLPPRFGQATRRVIAINAVLAGCRPEHLPVLITAVRALARPEVNLRGVNATTHPVAPLLIVHGTAAVSGGYNSGIGAFGPGNRANAATGRALRLILIPSRTRRPGTEERASPNRHVAGQVTSRCNVRSLSNRAIVVHRRPGVHNRGVPNDCSRLHDPSSHDDRAGPKFAVGTHVSSRAHQGGNLPTITPKALAPLRSPLVVAERWEDGPNPLSS